MYSDTDKIVGYLTKRYVAIWSRFRRTLLSVDELGVLNAVNDLYAELDKVTREQYLRLANRVYQKHNPDGEPPFDWNMVNEFLLVYSPITKYIYAHELDRKRARFYESLIASGRKMMLYPEDQAKSLRKVGTVSGDVMTERNKEITKAMKQFSKQVNEYAIEITDNALIKAYKDSGVTKVEWVTRDDEKTCTDCLALDAKVFDIDNIPAKPHWGCRCELKPVMEGQDGAYNRNSR